MSRRLTRLMPRAIEKNLFRKLLVCIAGERAVDPETGLRCGSITVGLGRVRKPVMSVNAALDTRILGDRS